MESITIEEGQDMDYLLRKILGLKETHSSRTVEVNYLWNKFLFEKGEFYITDLVYKILDHLPKVLVTDGKKGIRTTVWPSPLLENFLATGGFTKLAEQQVVSREQKQELDRLNLEKARYDVKNVKRVYKTYWWTFAFSVIALLISLVLLYLRFVGNGE